ncbi:LANO_0E00364g1_1 [Lachancea nothofagi CBS 11611]|uniref:LANO_0E00364g1_1 n=1 Tax=Lachancea nothofagi CBS 11611 TaxID=1266666 RepID=A0A1G4JNW0_9SACH|nr:LANO_0E00364g1_1 [Lachancea nothofagi CBS 11611]
MNIVAESHRTQTPPEFNNRLADRTNLNERRPGRPVLGPAQHSSRYSKVCARCDKVIARGSLKALGRYYHEDCFVCYDCGKVCKPKYFPFEDPASKQLIPLCQQDYFKRNNLLCFVCGKALRGVYYNAFGKLYDEEHFCCKICKEKCGVNTCFNYKDDLYCKYHFLKYFSNRCKGCNYPISDQYIEFPRGEEVHRWHPECYGVHKYWHVNLPPEAVGLPQIDTADLDDIQRSEGTGLNRSDLERYVVSFSKLVSKTWSVLYRFEEETAVCISDMFQYLTSFDQLKGLNSTALFVLKVECLFKALDSLDSLFIYNSFQKMTLNDVKVTENGSRDSNSVEANAESSDMKYAKFPRNLSTKIMIYLQLLRKLSSASREKDVSVSSLMSVITGVAHFLKLLVRHGLQTALDRNKTAHSANALVKFLREIEKNEHIEGDPFDFVDVTIDATDCCASCGKYIQEDCIQFKNLRWHRSCFNCSICQKHIGSYGVADAAFNAESKSVLCAQCAVGDPDSTSGFKSVSKLAQLIFLLKIALIRSKAVMEIQLKNREALQRSNSVKESISMQQTYIRTLNDIKRLKSRRQSIPLTTTNQQEARRSRILETSEIDMGKSTPLEDKCLVIQTDKSLVSEPENQNMFNSTKTLTLDDISRIVAAEQARELRPNAFTHFKKLKDIDDDVVNLANKKSGIYYSELQFEELYLVKLIALSLLSSGPDALIKDDAVIEKLIPVPPPKNQKNGPNFWAKMKVIMTKDGKKPTNRKVFGSDLDLLTFQWGVDSDLGIGPSKIKIPIIVDELISSLRQLDMSVEGVFRKNGNIRKLRELSKAIDDSPSEVPDLSKENAVQLSALLKKFLREMPDPVLTSQLYDLWIQVAKVESDLERHKYFGLLYASLPTFNRNVAEVLFSFLHWTSSFSHIDSQMGSKMDIHNLSTVIAPNILYQQGTTSNQTTVHGGAIHNTYNDAFAQNEGENYFLAIEVIDYLINHNEDLSVLPKYMVNLLQELKEKRLISFESVKNFIDSQLKANNLNYSEYDMIKPVNMKKSASVAKLEVKGNEAS